MSEFEVVPAEICDQTLIENLSQLYFHDFSEHWRRPIGADGRFVPFFSLSDYWTRSDHQPFVLRVEGRPAGFALVNPYGTSQAPLDHRMAEFFVLRSYRRNGFGRRGAHMLFHRLPGRWEVPVLRSNLAAIPFWRKAVQSTPCAQEIAEIDTQSNFWNGTVFRFSNAAAPAAQALGTMVERLRVGPETTLAEKLRRATQPFAPPVP